MKLTVSGLWKRYGRANVVSNVNFELETADSLVITGPNGSGKTTLVRLLCGLLAPSKGDISYEDGTQKLPIDDVFARLGLVGPYLQYYRDLTAYENMHFIARARGLAVDKVRIDALLERVGLGGRGKDELRTYSSGMLQRFKYVAALYHDPPIVVFDEPTANLDTDGADIVYDLIQERQEQRMLILATNEPHEIRFGNQHVRIAQ